MNNKLTRWWGVLCVIVIASVTVQAQSDEKRWYLGTGIIYDSYMKTPGVNLNVTYRIWRGLHVGPDFSSLLTREEHESGKIVKRKELEYNLNSTYEFKLSERVWIYPLTGVNWSKVTVHPKDEEAVKRFLTGANLGAGAELETEWLTFFCESKYVTHIDKFAITVGVVFGL